MRWMLASVGLVLALGGLAAAALAYPPGEPLRHAAPASPDRPAAVDARAAEPPTTGGPAGDPEYTGQPIAEPPAPPPGLPAGPAIEPGGSIVAPDAALPAPPETPTPGDPACATDPVLADQVLMKVKPGIDAAAVAARHGGTVTSTIGQLGISVVVFPPGRAQAALPALAADPDVEFAEPDRIVSIPEQPRSGDGCGGGAAPARPG